VQVPITARRRRRTRAAAVLATAGVALMAGLAGPLPSAQAAAGSVQGVVFLDFDGDGVYDTTGGTGIPVDRPVSGVTVAAYDALNAQVGAAVTTDAAGAYTLDTTAVADGTPLRIEFTGLPDGSFDGYHGPDSGTSVQFAVAGTEGVDFSIVRPAFYSSPSLDGAAPLVQAIQRGANRAATGGGDAANVTQPSLVSIPWNVADNRGAASIPATWSARTTLALTPQTGSLGGSSFDRAGADLYVAAEFRRFADLGPLGLGGIYVLDDVLADDGTVVAPADMTADIGFVDLAALGVDVGQSMPELAPDQLTSVARGLGDTSVNPATFTATDATAYAWTGRAGIGGIAVSSDSSLLYVVNRFDSRLYAVTLPGATGTAPALAGSWDLGLAPGDQASAVLVDDGVVYVGVVDTGGQLDAPLPGNVPDAGASTASGTMRVYAAAETAGALAPGAAFGVVLTHALGVDYPRGVPIVPAANAASTVPERFKVWHNWTNQWDAATFNVLPRTSPGISWSQPMLSDLEITADGYLVLTLADRFALQNGVYNIAPTGGSTLYYAYAQGDVLVAAPTLQLEDDGQVTGLTRGWTNTTNLPDQGVGGGEFFDDNVNQSNWRHDENGLGWSATFPGVDEVAMSAYDPVDPNLDVAGVRFSSASGGVNQRGFIQTTATGGFFQKAGGLGSVTLLLAEAPVEIGNRVWLDADLNGRQDPDEPAIDGAPVELFAAVGGAPSGAALAATTTASVDGAPGTYYFSSLDVAGLEPEGEYVVVFGQGTGAVALAGENAAHPGFAGLDWSDLRLTRQTSALAIPTTDSNPDPATGEAPVSVGGPGENDHSIDAGFVAFGAFEVTKALDAQGATPIEGQTFTIEVTAGENFRGQDVLAGGAPYAYPDPPEPWNPAWEHDWTMEPTTFTFRVVGGSVEPVDAAAVPQQLPIGYLLTLVEQDAGDVADVVYAPASADGTSAEVLITVNGGEPLTVSVTNTLLPDGEFSIEKLLTGDAAAVAAASGVSFSVAWSADTGPSGTIEVTGGQTSEPVTVPAGSIVTLAEAQPVALPQGVVWAGHGWSGTGVTPTTDGGASLEVASAAEVAVVLTNTLEVEPELPVTGSDVPWMLAAAGAGALIVGGILLAARRRTLAARTSSSEDAPPAE